MFHSPLRILTARYDWSTTNNTGRSRDKMNLIVTTIPSPLQEGGSVLNSPTGSIVLTFPLDHGTTNAL